MGMKFTRRGLFKRLGLTAAAAAIAPALPEPARAYKHTEVANGFTLAPVKAEGGPAISSFCEPPEAFKRLFAKELQAELRKSSSLFVMADPQPKAIQFEKVSDPYDWSAKR